MFICDLPLSSHDTQCWPFQADPLSGNLCIQRVLHDNTVTVQGLVCSIIYRRLLCVWLRTVTRTQSLKTGNERHICIYTARYIYTCFCVLSDFRCLNLKVKTLIFPCMHVYMYVCTYGCIFLCSVLYILLTKHATWPVTISLCHLVQTPSLHNPNPA